MARHPRIAAAGRGRRSNAGAAAGADGTARHPRSAAGGGRRSRSDDRALGAAFQASPDRLACPQGSHVRPLDQRPNGTPEAMYDIDPNRIDLAQEFKARPYGEHSPDLQALLNLMRRPSAEPFHLLVMSAGGERWTLALMQPGAEGPPQLTNTVFSSPEAAEWHVFKLRWQALTGRELPID